MTPLKVKKYRDYWVINAARVGLSIRHGNFATKAEAVAEAERLVAKNTLGLSQETASRKITGAFAIQQFSNAPAEQHSSVATRQLSNAVTPRTQHLSNLSNSATDS